MAGLSQHINKALEQALSKRNNQVADTIKYTEAIKVEEEVYQAYQPIPEEDGGYARRKLGGGLASPENMKHEVIKSGNKVKMIVANMTPPNKDFNSNGLKKGELSDLVEKGHGYKGLKYSSDSGAFTKPRPFQEATKNELRRNKGHVQALENELKRKGVKVRRI